MNVKIDVVRRTTASGSSNGGFATVTGLLAEFDMVSTIDNAYVEDVGNESDSEAKRRRQDSHEAQRHLLFWAITCFVSDFQEQRLGILLCIPF